jgi:hypothetical protein
MVLLLNVGEHNVNVTLHNVADQKVTVRNIAFPNKNIKIKQKRKKYI